LSGAIGFGKGFAQAMTPSSGFIRLVWLALIQIRKEAEHAADDATLAGGVQAPIMPTGWMA